MIIHVADSKDIIPLVSYLPLGYEELTSCFWPGPLTLVLPVKHAAVPDLVHAHLPTQAFRIPQHPLALNLLKETGPVVAPSANLSGRPSAVTALHVEKDFGQDFPVLDGGECLNGVESTILIWRDKKWHLGRLGAIAPQAFLPMLGYEPQKIFSPTLLCPGQKYRHYAPQAKLDLSGDFKAAQVILGFSDRHYPEDAKLIFFSRSDQPKEALRSLYAVLRTLDEQSITEAYVDIQVPDQDLWSTFLERIKKAAAH